jgi:hypothetical protein
MTQLTAPRPEELSGAVCAGCLGTMMKRFLQGDEETGGLRGGSAGFCPDCGVRLDELPEKSRDTLEAAALVRLLVLLND